MVCAHQDCLRRRGPPRNTADVLEHHLIGSDRKEEALKGFASVNILDATQENHLANPPLYIDALRDAGGLVLDQVDQHISGEMKLI